MKTDLKAALEAVSKRLHERGTTKPIVDDLIELTDGCSEYQLAVWQAGYTWGPEAPAEKSASIIRASAPSDNEPQSYEVIGQRGGWLKCKAADSSEAFKVALIRRDWVVEEDREKFDRLLESSPAV